ncbi:50S ribosomal protein L14 [Candidatus Shapirobacteria bacterium]|nr:50S ribosomal protein L14 [Candidatus Shapirobacteria bacterium]
MLQLRSILVVADNSGAKRLKLVNVPGYSKKHIASVGEIIDAVVFEAFPDASLKKGDKVKAVIIRTRKEKRRPDGSYIRFSDNAAVVINSQKAPVGTRIFGPIAMEVKEKGFNKIASLAKEVV